MPFDIKTARPIKQSIQAGFDIKTARPAQQQPGFGLTPQQQANLQALKEKMQFPSWKERYSEVVAPIMHGGSSFLFGAPREIARRIHPPAEKFLFPEQTTPAGKMLRFPAEVAGLLTGGATRGAKLAVKGATKVLPRLAGKGLLKTALKGGIGATTFGLLQSPPAGKERVEQAREFGTIGLVTPFAVAGTGKLAQYVCKTGRWISRELGGVSDATVKIIKRLGAHRVFDPLKAKIDYISTDLVPRVKRRVTDLIINPSLKSKMILKEVGFKPEEIETLSKIDRNTLNHLRPALNKDWGAIKTSLETIKSNADLQFKIALERQPHKGISIKPTYFKLRDMLRKQGWIDKENNVIKGAGIFNKTKSNLVKIYRDLERTSSEFGEVQMLGKPSLAQGHIDSTGYFNKLSELEASISGNAKFDRLVFEIQKSLRDEAVKVIPGLKAANKAYSDAIKLSKMENLFSKVLDPVNIEKRLVQLKNVSKAQLQYKYRRIMGLDLYDDLQAHLANQDFELSSDLPRPGSGSSIHRSQLGKKLITSVAKGYYEKVDPKIMQLRRALEKSAGRIKEVIK